MKLTASTKASQTGFSNEQNQSTGKIIEGNNESEQKCAKVSCNSNSLLRIDNEVNIIAKYKGLKIDNFKVNSLMKHLDEIHSILRSKPSAFFQLMSPKLIIRFPVMK